jgi:hypothetical protein
MSSLRVCVYIIWRRAAGDERPAAPNEVHSILATAPWWKQRAVWRERDSQPAADVLFKNYVYVCIWNCDLWELTQPLCGKAGAAAPSLARSLQNVANKQFFRLTSAWRAGPRGPCRWVLFTLFRPRLLIGLANFPCVYGATFNASS